MFINFSLVVHPLALLSLMLAALPSGVVQLKIAGLARERMANRSMRLG